MKTQKVCRFCKRIILLSEEPLSAFQNGRCGSCHNSILRYKRKLDNIYWQMDSLSEDQKQTLRESIDVDVLRRKVLENLNSKK